MKRIMELVRPTETEVATGVSNNCCKCPYALATRRALGIAPEERLWRVYVDAQTVTVEGPDPDDVWGRQLLPLRVQQRLADFDGMGGADRARPWPGFYLAIELPESKEAGP